VAFSDNAGTIFVFVINMYICASVEKIAKQIRGENGPTESIKCAKTTLLVQCHIGITYEQSNFFLPK